MKKIAFILSMVIGVLFILTSSVPKKDYLLTISTSEGDMKVVLYENTPAHKEKFLTLVQSGYFDNKPIYRIIDELGIHFGDGKDMKNLVKDERVNPHKKGALASLRIKDTENPTKQSSLGQFYIVNTDKELSFLNNAYTVFGEVVSGIDVLDKLSSKAVNGEYQPVSSLTFSISMEEMKPKKITKTTGYTYP